MEKDLLSAAHNPEVKTLTFDVEKSAEDGVLPVVLSAEKQVKLKCQVGQHLFVDKTWTKINFAEVLQDLEENQNKSCFWGLKKYLKRYKGDEILIGYEPFRSKENEFIMCVTEDANNSILECLHNKHKEFLRRIQSSKNVVARPWNSLGSELEIADCQVSCDRDVVSYEWIGDASARQTTIVFEDLPFSETRNLSVSLVAHRDDKFNIRKNTVFDVGVQAIPPVIEEEVQTLPTIPTNACTQYAPESQVPATSDQEKTVELHELDAFCKKYRDEFSQILSYNEVYDLYHDDYPALVKDKPKLSDSLRGTYAEYQCLNNVAASEGKHVSCIAWHTSLTGVLAVAYVSKHRCELNTTDSSDENSISEKSLQNGADESEKKVKIDLTNKYLPDHHETKSLAAADQDPTDYEKDVERLKSLQKGSKGQTKRLGLRKKLAAHVAFAEHLELKKQPKISGPAGNKLEKMMPKKTEEVTTTVSGISDDASESDESEESVSFHQDDTSDDESSEMERNVLGPDSIIISDFDSSDPSSPDSEPMNLPPIKQKPSKSLDVTKLPRGSLFPPSKDMSLRGRRKSASPKLPVLTKAKESKLTGKKTESRQGHVKQESLDEGILNALGLNVKDYLKEYLSPVNKSQSCDYSSSKSLESGLSAVSASFSDVTESDGDYREHGLEFEFIPDDDLNDNDLVGDELAPQILEPKNPVLIWSFDDDIKPKVCLDSPYDLQCIKFCPHNGNLLAGGSVSGVIVLWDLAGHFEGASSSKKKPKEKSEYMLLLESMMQWQEDYSWDKVRPTAVSSRSASHLDAITCLDWVYPLIEITPNGRLAALPKDQKSLQLITGSLDGTLKVWDLTCSADEEPSAEAQDKSAIPEDKRKSRKRRTSLFRKLSKNWMPIYTLKVINNKMMLQPVSKFHFNFPAPKFKRQSSSAHHQAETLEDQVSFTFEGTRLRNEDLMYEVVIATGSDFGVYSWEGFEFEVKNNPKEEFAKRLWFGMIHDGEIVSLHRSTYFTNVIATAGGHIIALWHTDYEDGPIWWKRYPVLVTCIQFSQYKPTAFIVSRADGFVEIFDLIRQSHDKVHSFFVSGKVITEIAEPILPFVSGLCSVADYHGIIRLYHVPSQYHHINPDEIETVREFLDREPERRRAMNEWNKSFQDSRASSAELESDQDLKKDPSKPTKAISAFKRAAKYQEEAFKWYTRRRGSFPWIRKKKEEWFKKEEKFVLQTVIDQKKVNRKEMTLLMRPIIQEEQEKAEKYAKAEKRIKEADRIFQSAINLLFPKPPHRFEREVSPQKRDRSIDEMEVQIIAHFGPNGEERDQEVLKRIRENPWIPEEYDWGKVLEKHDSLRRVFNDPSRKRDQKLRWLRKKLITIAKEEKCPIYRHKNHYERYLRKKLVNRYRQLDHLRQIYGPDYELNWTSDSHIREKLASESAEKSDQFVLEPAETETHSDLDITPPASEVELELRTDATKKHKERSQAEQLEYLKSLFSPGQLKNYKSRVGTERKRPTSMLRLLDASQLTKILGESILVERLNELTFDSDEEDKGAEVEESSTVE